MSRADVKGGDRFFQIGDAVKSVGDADSRMISKTGERVVLNIAAAIKFSDKIIIISF